MRLNFLKKRLKDISNDVNDISKQLFKLKIDRYHRNMMLNPLLHRDVYYNLEKFMFSQLWDDMPGNLPPFIGIAVYLRDTMLAIKYLHGRPLYHLAICPRNIFIVRCPENPSGIVKIGNFPFTTYSDKGIVENQRVGLGWIYR